MHVSWEDALSLDLSAFGRFLQVLTGCSGSTFEMSLPSARFAPEAVCRNRLKSTQSGHTVIEVPGVSYRT